MTRAHSVTAQCVEELTEAEDDGDVHGAVLVLADDPGVPRLLLSPGHRQSSLIIIRHHTSCHDIMTSSDITHHDKTPRVSGK